MLRPMSWLVPSKCIPPFGLYAPRQYAYGRKPVVGGPVGTGDLGVPRTVIPAGDENAPGYRIKPGGAEDIATFTVDILKKAHFVVPKTIDGKCSG